MSFHFLFTLNYQFVTLREFIFTEIKFHKLCEFCLISPNLVPVKIIGKLSIRKIRKILEWRKPILIKT